MKKISIVSSILFLVIAGSLYPTLAFAKNDKPTHTPKPQQTQQVAAVNTPATPTAKPTAKPVAPTASVKSASISAKPTLKPTTKPSTQTPTKKPTTPAAKKPTSTPILTKRVSIRGQIAAATVTSVKGSTITIAKEKKTYTVLAVNATLYRKHYWGSSTLQDIAVNDKVNVTGNWINSSKTIMEATLIRNLSVVKRRGVVFGTVTTRGANTLTIKPKDHLPQKVTITAKTSLVNNKEVPISFSQIKVGDQIRVKGMWDREKNSITEVTQIKDFSATPSAQTP